MEKVKTDHSLELKLDKVQAQMNSLVQAEDDSAKISKIQSMVEGL